MKTQCDERLAEHKILAMQLDAQIEKFNNIGRRRLQVEVGEVRLDFRGLLGEQLPCCHCGTS